MSIFDLFKKKKTTEPATPAPAAPAQSDEAPEAVGWQAIEDEFTRIYPGQDNPKHFGPIIKWIVGGNDPLDGISVYDGGDYWHFVSFGLTEIYEKECDDPSVSGYGYELTFKLKKEHCDDEEGELKCICGILQMIARLTFTKNEIFRPFEFIYTGQTTGIDAYQKSNLTGFITIADPTVNAIDTPNGRVEFLELIGMTDAELKTLSSHASVEGLYNRLGSDITDYHRASIV